jgi:hypothetical protein
VVLTAEDVVAQAARLQLDRPYLLDEVLGMLMGGDGLLGIG